jgi:hypothetical protein
MTVSSGRDSSINVAASCRDRDLEEKTESFPHTLAVFMFHSLVTQFKAPVQVWQATII